MSRFLFDQALGFLHLYFVLVSPSLALGVCIIGTSKPEDTLGVSIPCCHLGSQAIPRPLVPRLPLLINCLSLYQFTSITCRYYLLLACASTACVYCLHLPHASITCVYHLHPPRLQYKSIVPPTHPTKQTLLTLLDVMSLRHRSYMQTASRWQPASRLCWRRP